MDISADTATCRKERTTATQRTPRRTNRENWSSRRHRRTCVCFILACSILLDVFCAFVVSLMTLSDLSIKNPVFAVMLSAAMIVFGYLGYRDMGVSQFPEIDFPVVNILVKREAASPDVMDGDVTDVIEDAVAGVEGVDYITSQSL